MGSERIDDRPPGSRRVFVAVFPPAPVTRAVAAGLPDLAARWPDLRPVRAAGLHVTLRFLGDLGPGERASVGEILADLAAGVRPFPVRLTGLGVFPPGRPPRVLWLGVAEGAARLEALARGLERRLVAGGFPPGGTAFHPHLTLGRFGRSPRERELPAFPDPPGFVAGQVDLVASDLGRGGSRYTVLLSEPFAGSDDLTRPSPR